MKSLFKNVALLMTTSALCLIASEYIARYVFREITTTTDNRSYFAQRWKRAHVKLNSLGFRDKERDWANTVNAYRIVLIGDSYTFGQGLPEHERMSNLLEDELRKRRGAVEVVNLGKAGHHMSDAVKVLRTALDQVKPHYVLFQWFVNDVEIPEHVAVSVPVVAVEQGSRLNQLKMYMRRRSVLYFLAAETWHALLEGSGAGYVEDMLTRFGDPNSSESERARKALRQFMTIASEHDIPLGIVLVPYLTPLPGKEYPFSYLHDRVLADCETHRVPCLDLLPTFAPVMRDENRYRDLWVNRFDSHMGSAANKIAVARMLEFFGPSWVAAREVTQ